MILITGGTGLVGSHLLLELCKKGLPVRALYRKGANREWVRKVFEHYSIEFLPFFDKIEWVEGDITDVLSLEDAMKGVTHVYHCAALVSFNKRDYYRLMKVNAEGTANVVNACLDANVRKLCYVSSVAALGKGIENTVLTENDKWEKVSDVSNYSISKHLAEQEVWRGTEEGLNAVMVNPCVIFGPQNWDTGSNAIFKSIYEGLSFYTPGSNAIVDVRVVVDAMIRLMDSDITAERYLVITENMNFKSLCEKIAKAMNKKAPHRLAGKFLVSWARRMEALRCRLSGSTPRITKETVNAAFKNYSYSIDKLKKQFPDFNFGNTDDTIQNAVRFLEKNCYGKN